MDQSNSTGMNYFDMVRHRNGPDALTKAFLQIEKQDRVRMLKIINNPNLSFTSLYLLKKQLTSSRYITQMSVRNQYAIKICEAIEKKIPSSTRNLISSSNPNEFNATLRWMVETGSADDGLSNKFDEVMDTATSYLTKLYQDPSLLPVTAAMIFKRCREGRFYHDLVWAFFESRNPLSLALIASYLCSTLWDEAELARKLLSFIPCIVSGLSMDCQTQYLRCLEWLKENTPFMRYTGESFQQSYNPAPYTVCLEAKYMCNPNLTNPEKELNGLSPAEAALLRSFKQLDQNSQIRLSDYSYLLYRNNIQHWYWWRSLPIDEQIKAANKTMGGFR
ncbi:MAG: hypothetical protein N2484_12400 [Clostridia bacterium]|nr:hypothetical protein [Clostridia bacterium]